MTSSEIQSMNIALFGTSADPPTRGHSKILTWLSQHYDQVAIWAADNPFKQHHASLDHRNAMVQTLTDELKRSNIRFLPELSYRRSIMTVARAHKLWPKAELTLVIGSDLVSQLPSWYQAQELLDQANLLVMPRPGTPLNEQSLLPLKQMGARITIADMEGLNVSSTAYRDRGLDNILSPAVEAYITQTALYDSEKRSIRQLPQAPSSTNQPSQPTSQPTSQPATPCPPIPV